jgi:tetratricopeptide (TPR) repeat protein
MNKQKWLLVFYLVVAPLAAHPDPMHDVEFYTQQIEAGDTRPELYLARGQSWRLANKFAEATADFHQAIKLKPDFTIAQRELSETLFSQGQIAEAVTSTRSIFTQHPQLPAPEKANLHSDLARYFFAEKKWRESLAAITAAQKENPRGKIDWYVLRSEIERELGQLDQAIATLRTGYDTLQGSSLLALWVDALLDAQRGLEVATIIDQEITQRRFNASWLIRRGRLALAEKKATLAEESFTQAQVQLDEIINTPLEPDPISLIERAKIHYWRGQRDLCQKDYDAAKALQPEPDVIRPVERLLSMEKK